MSRWALSQLMLKTTVISFHSSGMGFVSSCSKLAPIRICDGENCVGTLTSSRVRGQPQFYRALLCLHFSPVTRYTGFSFTRTLQAQFPVWFLFSKAFAKVGKCLPIITRKLLLYCSLLWSLHWHDPLEILSTPFFFMVKKTYSPYLTLEQINCTLKFPLNG